MTRALTPYILYPALMALAIVTAMVTLSAGAAFGLAVVLCTGVVGATVCGLERLLPFRPSWRLSVEDLKADALHGVLSNGVPSMLLEAVLKGALVDMAASLRTRRGLDLWPDSWPLPLQVLLALFAAEVGFYTCHRLFHESKIDWLWNLHAVHHSSTRMYFLAGSRTHPLQVTISFGVTVAILWALGASDEVIFWKTVLHTANGILQHANLDIRLGPLNWVIAGPELHRSHHSVDVAESNHNYGNNLILIDVLLGTRHLPRAAPDALGLPPTTRFANTFVGHLLLPFTMGRGTEARDDGEQALQ